MKEKVRVTGDTLRNNFPQWLDKAIDKRKEKNITSGNLIILIDGVDKYTDGFGKEDSPDWITTDVPPGVRIIYSCNLGTRAYTHIAAKTDNIITVQPLSPGSRQELYRHFCNNFSNIQTFPHLQKDIERYPICGNPLYLTLLLHFSFSNVHGVRKFKYTSLQDLPSIESLLVYIIDFYSNKEFKHEEVSRFLRLISLSRSGISGEELDRLSNTDHPTALSFLEVFAPVLHNSQGFYLLKNGIYREVVFAKFAESLDPLRNEFILALDENCFTIRKIDELLHQLCEAKMWMKLKDMLIQLEVFAVLYSSAYKMELCMYWVRLVQQHFDPVQEYNRSLEEFVIQYSPSSKDLFIMLVQFCRFFKDLAEVELNFTYCFRHPHFRGYYELREINLIEEIESLSGMYYPTFQSPIKEDEVFMHDSAPSNWKHKEKNIFERIDNPKDRTLEFYYYKRWLWVQFPWCAIDMNSNFSKSMNSFKYFSDVTSPRDEMNIFLSIIKLVGTNKNNKYRDTTNISNICFTASTKFTRTTTQNKASRGLIILPELKSQKIIIPHIESDTKVRDRRFLSSSMNINYNEDREYSLDLSFKDLVPDNILQKIGSQVLNYTHNELVIKKRETLELQKYFNRLRDELRNKNLKLEALESQIAKSLDKLKEQEEIRNRVNGIEMQLENVIEKIFSSEDEGKRLQKILVCCMKNPTRNDEWERGLEKALDNLNSIISRESELIKDYEKETSMFEEQSSVFQKIKDQRNLAQNNTILRAENQLLLKSKMKRNMRQGVRRRLKIINSSNQLNISEENTVTIKKYEVIMQSLENFKQIAAHKLEGYLDMVEKLSVFRSFEDSYSLSDIISTFHRNSELREEIIAKKSSIEEMKREKQALELQVQFFQGRKQKERDRGKPIKPSNFEGIMILSYETEKKLEHMCESLESQQFILMKAKDFIENCWKGLMINMTLSNKDENLGRNFEIIKERAMQISELTCRNELLENKRGDSEEYRYHYDSTKAASEVCTAKSDSHYFGQESLYSNASTDKAE